MIARKSRYGKLFWGCNTYPKCNFAVWDKPIEKPCGQCKFPIVVEKNTKRYGLRYSCPDCRALFNDQFEFLMIVPPRPSRFKKAESTTEAKAPAKEKKTSAKKASKKPSKSKKKVVLEES